MDPKKEELFFLNDLLLDCGLLLLLGALLSCVVGLSCSFPSSIALSVEERVTGVLVHDFDLILLLVVVEEELGRRGGDIGSRCAGDDFSLVDVPLLGTV